MRRVVHAVGIALAARVKPRVKIGRYGAACQHADIARKAGVERKGVFLRRDTAEGVKVRPLAHGVHARVGATGSRYADGFAGKLPKRFFHALLYGDGVFL